jgi:hypothetical protein
MIPGASQDALAAASAAVGTMGFWSFAAFTVRIT